MDTVVAIQVIEPSAPALVEERVVRALGWFAYVEKICSRFEATSEVSRLAATVGVPIKVSPVLLQAVRLALAVARRTNGAFDPTVGSALERRGFNRSYRTGRRLTHAPAHPRRTSYRDVRLNLKNGTITLGRPVILDLGAVAKGLAVDLAAKELEGYANFAIDAGGDLVVRGRNPGGGPWRIGVLHPRRGEGLSCVLAVTNAAICTSGDYARRPAGAPGEHHLINPRTGRSPTEMASATVIAPTAVLADALATAAFVLGPRRGRRLLEAHGVEGVFITRTMALEGTAGFQQYLAR